MDGKTKAIVAHITLIGWIIALILNSQEGEKDEFASFYIRQMLGLMLASFVLSFVPYIGWVLWIVVVALWVISLIYSINGEKKPLPIVGEYFQDWFKSL